MLEIFHTKSDIRIMYKVLIRGGSARDLFSGSGVIPSQYTPDPFLR